MPFSALVAKSPQPGLNAHGPARGRRRHDILAPVIVPDGKRPLESPEPIREEASVCTSIRNTRKLGSMPLVSVALNWADNEEHGHDFGYEFGYRMFKPDGGYPEMVVLLTSYLFDADPVQLLYGMYSPHGTRLAFRSNSKNVVARKLAARTTTRLAVRSHRFAE